MRNILIASTALAMFFTYAYAVQVDGYCYLEYQTNHNETKVLFQADSPSAVTDSTYTDSIGYYQIDVAIGLYDINYTHEGYYDEHIYNQFFIENTTLDTINLLVMHNYISGSLSGVLEDTLYIVNGHIYINMGNSLIIQPGITFLFDGNYEFSINGYLYAVGTEEDSIKFKPYTADSTWGGIVFNDSADDSCRMEYCFITGSNSRGISFSESNPTIENCTISDNLTNGSGGGIYCNDSSPIILKCSIIGNSADTFGGGIYSADSNPTIENCTISGNSAYCGSGIYCYGYSPTIENCTISGNSASDDGGGIYCNDSSPTIKNCTISGNSADFGGGIYCNWSSPTILNTIVEGNSGDGGIRFFYSSNTSIIYSDFYNNENCNFTGNSIPQWLGIIITVNANGDSCDTFMNIFEDPLFVDPLNGDYHLQENSPCIDAGDPDPQYYDPDGTIADIGAFYFDQSGTAYPEIDLSADSLYFPETVIGEIEILLLTIYNIGEADLIIHDISSGLPDIFGDNWNPSDSIIVPGDSLNLEISFSPLENMTYTSQLMIQNNDQNVNVYLHGEGIAPVAISMTPLNPPLIIPEGGGLFEFNIAVANNSGAPQTLDLWTVIVLPNMGYVPILSLMNFTFPPATIDRDRSQTVPGYAPGGTYTYYGYLGDYPWVVDHMDSFTFVKEGSDESGYLGSPSDWLCSGEPFTGEGLPSIHPSEFILHPSYPNPFNPETNLTFDLPAAGNVSLVIYDVNGREIVRLVDGWRQAGVYEAAFNASSLSSGVYFARLQAGNFQQTRKIILLK